MSTSREKGYVATFWERNALFRNFVTGIEIVEHEAVLA